jgi:hypothetical protein
MEIAGGPAIPLLRRDSRELIVTVLSERQPLTIRQIHEAIVKDHRTDLTYQAVHKAIKQLVQDGVLENLGRDYTIKNSWLKEVKDRTDRLLANIDATAESVLHEISKTGSVNLRFEQLLEFGKWVVRFHAYLIAIHPETADTVFIVRRVWPANLMVGEDYARFKVAFSKPVFSLVRGSSPMDYALMDIPEKLGAKKRLGVDVASLCDTVVIGDYVYNVYYARSLRTAWDSLYENTTPAAPLNLKGLHDLVHKRGHTIRVVLTKSPDVAKHLREEAAVRFRAYPEKKHAPTLRKSLTPLDD